MEDLLSKEYYCYKIHSSIKGKQCFPSFIDNPAPSPLPYMDYSLHFYKKILVRALQWSLKNLSPL